ncbi:MAG: hypothetical protein J2P38_02100 [Candidatus Dormibacteraeota bacterium]|nr:hypothetical protein [Candidatus Dormibacteraeota bacterium]
MLLSLGAALVVVALTGVAALLLLATWLAGIGLTYAVRTDLRLEERLAWGAPVGAVVVGMVLLLLGLLAGRLTVQLVLLALAFPLGAGAILAWLSRPRLGRELALAAARWRRGEPWPLWLLLLACWPYTLVLLGRSYRVTHQGIVSGTLAAYADWSAHLTYASSFAFAQNFPPRFPIYAGHAMTYPFLVDLWAAGAVVLGTPVTSAVTVTSGMLSLALPPGIYFGWLRLGGRRVAALLAVGVFLLSGGLGFVFFLRQLARQGTAILGALPQLYTQVPASNLQWLNPVLAWIVPQRDVLLGFTLVAVGMAVLWMARRGAGWGPYVAVGTLTGLLPLANLDAYGTLVCFGVWWAFLERRRAWWGFLAPALVLGLPQTVWMVLGGAASIRVQLGWMSSADGAHQAWPVFWLLNTGLLVPLMALAFCWKGTLRQTLWWHLVPIWLWFLVPNVLVFQPWDWDNTKFFAYWLLIGALPVGLVLERLWGVVPKPGASRSSLRVLTVVLVISLVFAGTLDLARTLQPATSTAVFVDRGGVQAADWVLNNTAPDAVFLAAPQNNQPITVLAGRTVVAGYSGWTWSYGLHGWADRQQQVQIMLAGGPGTAHLVRRYGVQYVVIGPQEMALRASPAYWTAHGHLVYDRNGYRVFRVAGA